ncbi:MAG: hypothetical protein QF412_09415, partial [Planctomycetota bacterium]|nr:hypothetical protein [Planctomycetota bacterium]
MPHSCKLLLLAILTSLYATSVQAQKGPPRRTPAQVGIDYPIVACRMPVPQHPTQEEFPDAFRMSLKIGPYSALVLIHPSGKEEILFQPKGKGSCVDPFVSYDGRTIYFAVFEDPTSINVQRYLTRSPAHIWKLDVATRRATQLTFGNEMTWRDSANKIDPRYGPFDISPVELPDGRILFLSTRDGQFSVTARFPSPAFWRMNADGSNLEKMEYFSMSGCQHPLVLQDGRVIWTHRHNAGRRNRGGHNYALMSANQDLSDIKSFAGLHHRASAWHFATQLSDGDVVTTVYYHSNNFGHGALVRFPANPNDPSGNDFHPAHKGTNWAQNNIYGHTDHYRRIGERLATPWFLSKYYASLTFDAPARIMADGTRTGKSTMPAGTPDGHMVFIWSSGGVHDSRSHNADMFPNMKICFARNGMIPKRNDLIVLKESEHHYYMYPKPLVSYMRIHGMARPKLTAE